MGAAYSTFNEIAYFAHHSLHKRPLTPLQRQRAARSPFDVSDV